MGTDRTAFTGHDWLELIAFAQKVDREGYGYAAENYPPRFEDPTMQAIAADGRQLKFLYDRQLRAMDAWWDREPNAVDLLNAHNAEADRRGRDGSLWGIRCTDGHIIMCDSRAHRDGLLAVMRAEERRPGRRVPAARLRRFEARGDWHESALPA